MTDRPEGPIRRWSRLKRTQTIPSEKAGPSEKSGRGAAAPVAPPITPPITPENADGREVVALTDADERETSPASQPPPETDELQPDEFQPGELPDIASLDKDSDFSAFLRQGVPEELRRRALRVLWRSDPVLANLDGLNDYDEDFTIVHTVADAVRTAYKVGKGYLEDEDEDEKEATEQTGAGEEIAEPDEPADESTSTKPDPDTAGETAAEVAANTADGGSERNQSKT